MLLELIEIFFYRTPLYDVIICRFESQGVILEPEVCSTTPIEIKSTQGSRGSNPDAQKRL